MKIPVEIQLEQIESLLVSALEGGSNYWYQIEQSTSPTKYVQRTDPKIIFPHVDYPLNPGGYLTISSLEEPERPHARLDLVTIEQGLKIMAREYPRHFADIIDDDVDANTGDVFLQCCLYREVIYG